MAAADAIRVRVTGRGGHASAPHDALDPVPAAAAMVGALQTVLTRRVDAHHPAVLTIARIVAGTTNNVIPESARMEGTLRTLSEPVRSCCTRRSGGSAGDIALAYGCSASRRDRAGLPGTVNDETAVPPEVAGAGDVLGSSLVGTMPGPIMGSEDFSYVLERCRRRWRSSALPAAA